MVALWMMSAALTAALVVAGGTLLERSTTGRRRWLWLGTLAAAVAAPFGAPALRGLFLEPAGLDVLFGPMEPVGTALGSWAAPAAAGGAGLDTVLVAAWVGASSALLLLLAGGILRTARKARRWPERVVDGVRVLVSDEVGPAVIGAVRTRVVVPGWVLDLPAAERGLVLAHEEEHRRWRDPAVLALGLLAPLAMPWNPALWWGFARLREAVETDCDRRVLRSRSASTVPYARLLVEVGARSGGGIPLGAGFGERTSSLERRIRLMLDKATGGSPRTLALRVALAALLVVAACSLEVNVNLAPTEEAPEAPTPAATPAADAPPTVEIPPPPGRVDEPDTPVLETERRAGAETRLPPPPDDTERDVAAGPTFTPFTVAPSILNRDEVIAAMAREYPPLLREAGIGGTVRLYFFIGEDGTVRDIRVDRTSGHEALDQAAMRVGSVYRFSPALNRDQRVPVWVSFPITFAVR